jgi:hypothetical protein
MAKAKKTKKKTIQDKVKNKFLSIRGAAIMIGASEKFLYNHVALGDIPSQRIGRKIFISENILTKMLESKSNQEDANEK